METRIIITYRWWQGDKNEVNPDHTEELDTHATTRITKMRAQDYTSGELNTEINGVNYSGWWETTTERV